MPAVSTPALHPRKTPLQARSAVTVEAILQATVQILVSVGKERLTTTRVAARAGVSVGTLYQYFPNKSSLLQACLRRHIDQVRRSIEVVCEQHRHKAVLEMGTALVYAYLDAKMHDVKVSAALYAVSSDVDGATITRAASARSHRTVADLLATANDGLTKDPLLVATVVLAALYGVARRLLETRFPERELEPLREELLVLVHAYLRTCVTIPQTLSTLKASNRAGVPNP